MQRSRTVPVDRRRRRRLGRAVVATLVATSVATVGSVAAGTEGSRPRQFVPATQADGAEPAPAVTEDDDMAWDETPPPPDTAPAPPPVRTRAATPRPAAAPLSILAGRPVVTLNDNGGWCWWQSPRATVTSDGELLAASTPSTAGAGGRGKATDVLAHDLATGRTDISTLMKGRLKSDDHNSGAVLELPSGRIVTAWAGHSQEPYMHTAYRDQGSATWQLGTPIHRPESAESLPTQGGFGPRAHVTYANLLWVQQENGGRGRLYNFFRGRGDQPVVMSSDDQGQTWTYHGEVFSRPTARPYAHYAAGPDGRIWFTVGLGHPHAARFNPVYAGYILGGAMYRSDGTFVTRLGAAVDPSRFTTVFQSNVTNPVPWVPSGYEPLNDTDAWGSDLTVDASGAPVMTFSVRKPERSPVPGKLFAQDQYWARLAPGATTWKVVRLGDAGSELVFEQPSYTGLSSIDPTDPYRVYASTNVHPATGLPLVSARDGRVHHEIWEATSADQGTTWTWAPVTQGSATDNLRPVLAARDGSWALLWLEGRYTDFVDDYDQAVVGIVLPAASPPATTDTLARTAVAPATRPLVGDFDGDGADDVIAYRSGTGADAVAFTVADGRRQGRFQPLRIDGTYDTAVGDIDRNGVDDVVWYTRATGATVAWLFDEGGSHRSVPVGTGPAGAQIRMGDFDGQGTADILYYVPGATKVWLAKAAGGWVVLDVSVSGRGYRPIVGDLTGDGVSDIAWYRPGGAVSTTWVWRRGLRTWSVRRFDGVVGTYTAVASDLDHDGVDDIWFADAPGTNRWLTRPNGWAKSPTVAMAGAVGVIGGADGRPRAIAELSYGRAVVNRRTP